MNRMSEAETIRRLVLTGLLVVGGSVTASVLCTHLSLVDDHRNPTFYRDAIFFAVLIPLIVAPIAYGYIAWLTWQLRRTNAELEVMAHTDALTCLPNRRAFVETIEIRLNQAGGDSLVFALVDLDHFKRINDTMGHATGDLALRHAADVLRDTAPADAIVARLGGEEFAVLLPQAPDNATGADAETRLEAMRRRLADLPLIVPGGVVRITASFGMAVPRPGEVLDSLLSRADDALYRAKADGRNRITRAA